MRNTRKWLSLLLALALVFALLPQMASPVRAAETSGKCGASVSWSYDEATCELTISGTGEMKDYSWNSSSNAVPWKEFQETIKKVTVKSGVTRIGVSAFESCTNLTSVSIANTVEIIGERAFLSCKSLPSITLPNGVKSIDDFAFGRCNSLTSMTFPDSVTTIDSWVFQNCANLTSVTLPKNVTSLGICVFEDCPSLTKVTLPNSITELPSSFFHGCTSLSSVTIPSSVKTIGNTVFSGCTGLKSIIIPNGVTKIDNCTFESCTGLTSVAIPDSVTIIGDRVFYSCAALTSIKIPHGVTEIGSQAFENCTGLTSVTVPAGVTSIGSKAFGFCSNLTEIKIESGNTAYCFENGALFTKDRKVLLQCLASNTGDYPIPDGVETLEAGSFLGCAGLTKIMIPEGVTSIGSDAFRHCYNLQNIVIPESVTNIGMYAFDKCGNLTSVTVLSKDCTIAEKKYTLGDPASTTVYGYEGSTAEAYANNYGYKFVSPPDPCAAGHDFKDGVCTRCGAKDPNYVDRTRLNEAIEKAKALKEVDYTPETFSKVKTALKSAEALPDDADQGAVDAAADALIAAMDALEEADPFRFEDVKDENAFYFNPVYWAYNAKPQITNGLDLIYFGPNSGCTRGQVVTFLWRAAGCPKPESMETAFTDLKPSAFYTKAVAWAVEKGITNGTTPTTFAPDDTCTRGQIVTFLYRAMNG